MKAYICTVAPAGEKRQIVRRPGNSYDIARPIGHSTMTVITSVDPPIIRFWEPYMDVSISREDAALMLRETRKNRTRRDDYHHQLRALSKITIHDIKRWNDERNII